MTTTKKQRAPPVLCTTKPTLPDFINDIKSKIDDIDLSHSTRTNLKTMINKLSGDSVTKKTIF